MMFESEYRYRPPFYLRRWVHVTVLLLFAMGVGGVIFVSVKLAPYQARAQDFDFADINKLEKASLIYDRNGKELGQIYIVKRDPVPIEKIPHHVIDAVVAAEDARFFKHDGVDRIGMIRAALRNFRARSFKQGASTITQQLARNAFNMKEKTYERKLIEAFLAMRIEGKFSKSEIMGMYLNRIYFGSGFWGVNAASKGYFGKEVSEISISDAAVLAGLIKGPNRFSPLNDPDASTRERNYVLSRMAEENMITEKELKELTQKPLFLAKPADEAKRAFDYPDQQVQLQVKELLKAKGENPATGGFHIYTTIDSELQQKAHQTLLAQLNEIEKKPDFKGQTFQQYLDLLKDWKQTQSKKEESAEEEEEKLPDPAYLQGALMVLENHTGAILAMVGGRDFDHSQYDRTTMTRRKAGTVFTPFVYAAGLKQGKLPGEKVEDSPISNRQVQIGGLDGILGEWGVEALENEQEGFMPARMALVKGKNAATVRYGMEVGVNQVVQLARDAGLSFEGELQKFNSTLLGNSEAVLSEMALAYTTFPNLGKRPTKPFLIQSIRDNEGKLIFRAEAKGPEVQVLNSYVAFQIHNALSDVLRIGTGKKAREKYHLGDFPAAGKTGTASDFKDLWFAGYTDKVTCVVWAGFDRASTIYPAAFSSDTVLPVWAEIMNATQKDFPAQPIAAPSKAQSFEVCTISGDRATEHCYHKEHGKDGKDKEVRDSYIEFFDPKKPFPHTCAVHGPGGVVNAAMRRPIKGVVVRPTPIGKSQVPSYIPKTQAVILHEPTVIGEDPYHSIPLRIRLKKVEPKPESPTPTPPAPGQVPAVQPPSEAAAAPFPQQEPQVGSPGVTGEPGQMPAVAPAQETAGIFVKPPGNGAAPVDVAATPNVLRALPMENAPGAGWQKAVPRPESERSPPARTEDGLPSILEEQPRYRMRPPKAQRIPFD